MSIHPAYHAISCLVSYLEPPDFVHQQPRDHGGGGGAVGVKERLHGQPVGPKGGAAVEAEPAEPQEACLVCGGVLD